MDVFDRIAENPFLLPNRDSAWEARAVFNPCVVKTNKLFHLLYRATSAPKDHEGVHMPVSTIAYADSLDGVHFKNRRLLIKPEKPWERFGCEDPRITLINDKYYIFYTALSMHPFSAPGIRVALAITKDFQELTKHPVTPFNAKAMALFPEKINGKYVAVLTVHTDLPPAKIALACFDKEEDIWSEKHWNQWYSDLDSHVIPLLRNMNDHVEVGAAPLKTKEGWLLIYSYIQNYFSNAKVFGVEAVLLDAKNPAKVIGKTIKPLLHAVKNYELHGEVPGVVFPSGALLQDEKLLLYYGAADTSSCLAIGNIEELFNNLWYKEKKSICLISKCIQQGFKRYAGNPIISPRPEFEWEAKATFNPAAVYENGRFHIVYRAMSRDDTSVFGYASSRDGFHFDERLLTPIYIPTANFELKLRPGNSGCEDPRITKLGDVFYMFYTAYDGYTPRVAFTSIKVADFINKRWSWETPRVITPPGIDDKDACLLSKKINNKYIIFHRSGNYIRINIEDNLNFGENKWLVHQQAFIKPSKKYWDNRKFGIASPPLETEKGWLLFYHRVAVPGNIYKIEAALLDLNNPTHVLAKTDAALLEPEMDYEKYGLVNNVIFPCGAVLLNKKIFLYYGAADRQIGVAEIYLDEVFKRLGV
jgi:beta-1,2-mannobiose phosphorylase / 1,2-beta-oligomannan phosphorylase